MLQPLESAADAIAPPGPFACGCRLWHWRGDGAVGTQSASVPAQQRHIHSAALPFAARPQPDEQLDRAAQYEPLHGTPRNRRSLPYIRAPSTKGAARLAAQRWMGPISLEPPTPGAWPAYPGAGMPAGVHFHDPLPPPFDAPGGEGAGLAAAVPRRPPRRPPDLPSLVPSPCTLPAALPCTGSGPSTWAWGG